MSAAARPASTADDAMGIDRRRSVTPREASVETASIVASTPNAIVSAKRPGTSSSK
jgi:hypothetical protein